MQELLLAWFREHGRDLPWRGTRDPYAILVSEVMLQQTQASRVVPRWLAWVERWPTVGSLAGAPTAEVICEWQGLGYNRRAVSLQRAAKVVAEHGWPDDLTVLPGVGDYTAAALGSFAFGEDVLPRDVNVERVERRTGTLFTGRAAQALMDLGAVLCTPRRPRCVLCPWRGDCAAAAAGVGRLPGASAAGYGPPGRDLTGRVAMVGASGCGIRNGRRLASPSTSAAPSPTSSSKSAAAGPQPRS